jgi:hypothetical protein
MVEPGDLSDVVRYEEIFSLELLWFCSDKNSKSLLSGWMTG